MCLRDLPTREQVSIPEFCLQRVCSRIFACCIFHAIHISPLQCMHSENVMFSSVCASVLMKTETLARTKGNRSSLHWDHFSRFNKHYAMWVLLRDEANSRHCLLNLGHLFTSCLQMGWSGPSQCFIECCYSTLWAFFIAITGNTVMIWHTILVNQCWHLGIIFFLKGCKRLYFKIKLFSLWGTLFP